MKADNSACRIRGVRKRSFKSDFKSIRPVICSLYYAVCWLQKRETNQNFREGAACFPLSLCLPLSLSLSLSLVSFLSLSFSAFLLPFPSIHPSTTKGIPKSRSDTRELFRLRDHEGHRQDSQRVQEGQSLGHSSCLIALSFQLQHHHRLLCRWHNSLEKKNKGQQGVLPQQAHSSQTQNQTQIDQRRNHESIHCKGHSSLGVVLTNQGIIAPERAP
mmetsp:Transcript_43205/g.85189  ORF Transcript_43205/g.85189 Transcript_43205/m.85189 type:complete len:216 (+) Transcript_43205:47-694(+)